MECTGKLLVLNLSSNIFLIMECECTGKLLVSKLSSFIILILLIYIVLEEALYKEADLFYYIIPTKRAKTYTKSYNYKCQ